MPPDTHGCFGLGDQLREDLRACLIDKQLCIKELTDSLCCFVTPFWGGALEGAPFKICSQALVATKNELAVLVNSSRLRVDTVDNVHFQFLI